VGPEQRVEPRAEGVLPAVEGHALIGSSALAAEIERRHEEGTDGLGAIDPARRESVELLDAARLEGTLGLGQPGALTARPDHHPRRILLRQLDQPPMVEVLRIGVLQPASIAALPVADEVRVERRGPADPAFEEAERELRKPARDAGEEQ